MTDRQEVAERLRNLTPSKQVHPDYTLWYTDICKAVGGKKDPWFGISALAERLADLIEPTCRIYYTDTSTDTHPTTDMNQTAITPVPVVVSWTTILPRCGIPTRQEATRASRPLDIALIVGLGW